eukprot:6467245-Amphidinium_carterae.1
MLGSDLGLAAKMRKTLFAMWMASPPPRVENLLRACENVVSIVSDMGTEAGLADFETTNIGRVLPAWITGKTEEGLELDDTELADMASFPTTPAGARVFPTAIRIPGFLHIIHNLSWYLDSHLEGFDTWLQQLKAVTTLLHYKRHRMRFVQRCVKKAALHSHHEHLFKKGLPLITEWRWGSITMILEQLLPLQTVLAMTFDAARFRGHPNSVITCCLRVLQQNPFELSFDNIPREN